MHEKQGIIRPGTTPDTEKRLPAEKQAQSKRRAEDVLDDDPTKRLAKAAATKRRR